MDFSPLDVYQLWCEIYHFMVMLEVAISFNVHHLLVCLSLPGWFLKKSEIQQSSGSLAFSTPLSA
jgi:hypothetical protein